MDDDLKAAIEAAASHTQKNKILWNSISDDIKAVEKVLQSGFSGFYMLEIKQGEKLFFDSLSDDDSIRSRLCFRGHQVDKKPLITQKIHVREYCHPYLKRFLNMCIDQDKAFGVGE